jgi:hypothetical protein
MDLKQYFRKIREVESTLTETYPLVTSLATEDGGKAGIVSEVPRYEAARTIVEGRARLATEEEKHTYREQVASALKAAEEAETARRLQLAMLFSADRINAAKPKSTK